MKTTADIENALSLERFNRYLAWAGNDHTRAIELYTLNSLISESLYVALQMLEVTLRNRIHMTMTQEYGEEWFYDDTVILIDIQRDQVKKALIDLGGDKAKISPGAMVAKLTFSFWTSMFNAAYENLWQKTLNKMAKTPDGKGLTRKDFSSPLTPIRTLRNRISHHEPVINWNLNKHYENILMITEYLYPPAKDWCEANSRFPVVYPAERISLIT